MKTIVYARYSTERQSEASIADQLRICRQYAESQAWAVASEFSDEGISGAAMGNRPGALAALDAANSGDVLLVTDLSRLSRSQDLAPLLTRLRHRGVRVIGVQDGFDSDSRTARMQAGLSGIMSEEFRAMIGDRTFSALERNARNGHATGGKAYENPEIVREIFGRFAAGESMKVIASDLNRRGVPSPGAKWKERARPRGRWLVSTLHTLLHNERYIGRLIWNRSRWVKDPDSGIRHRRARPQSEWVITECEALIDETTWKKAQARFKVRPGRGGIPRYLLSGILECALCGGKMICYGGSQHRYICGTYHGGGEHACANRSTFPREIAEKLILAPVIDDLLSPEAITEGIRLMRQERATPRKRSVPREILELERLVEQGVLSRETAEGAIEVAWRREAAFQADEPPIDQPWPSEKAWREAVVGMREILKGSDVISAREVLRELVGPAKCREAVDGNVAIDLTTRSVLLATGTGGRGTVDRFTSGPRYQSIYRTVLVPSSSRGRP